MSECKFGQNQDYCIEHKQMARDCLRGRIAALEKERDAWIEDTKRYDRKSRAESAEARVRELEKELETYKLNLIDITVHRDQASDSIAVLMKTVENQNAIRDELVKQMTKFASDPETAEVYLADWKSRTERAEAAAHEMKRQLVLADTVIEAARCVIGDGFSKVPHDFDCEKCKGWPKQCLFNALAAFEGRKVNGTHQA